MSQPVFESENLVLCYVDGPWAYFTSRPLSEQWGDDWNDAPYEHNAGSPYEPCGHNDPKWRNDPNSRRGWKPGTQTPLEVGELCRCDLCKKDWNDDGTPTFRIVRVAWDGPFETPCEGYYNGPWSVKQINDGAVAWLRPCDDTYESIPAGVSLVRFRELIEAGGGHVYEREYAIENDARAARREKRRKG